MQTFPIFVNTPATRMLALDRACLICRCLLKFIRNSIAFFNLTEIIRQYVTFKFNRCLENNYMVIKVNFCASRFHVTKKATTEKSDYGSREKLSHLPLCTRLFSLLIFHPSQPTGGPHFDHSIKKLGSLVQNKTQARTRLII